MKKVIVYFSRRGENYVSDGMKNLSIGNTEMVANYIQELTGADVFRLEPIRPYPVDYYTTTQLAKRELEGNYKVRYKNADEFDITKYDLIYLGYPNWWGTYPMIIKTFLREYDLTGKIIKPFCTHEGSGMGASSIDLKRDAAKATIAKEITIKGSKVKDAKEILREWVDVY